MTEWTRTKPTEPGEYSVVWQGRSGPALTMVVSLDTSGKAWSACSGIHEEHIRWWGPRTQHPDPPKEPEPMDLPPGYVVTDTSYDGYTLSDPHGWSPDTGRDLMYEEATNMAWAHYNATRDSAPVCDTDPEVEPEPPADGWWLLSKNTIACVQGGYVKAYPDAAGHQRWDEPNPMGNRYNWTRARRLVPADEVAERLRDILRANRHRAYAQIPLKDVRVLADELDGKSE